MTRHDHDRARPRRSAPRPPRTATRRRRSRRDGSADGVLELDTLLGGWSKVTAGYLLEGPRPCSSRRARSPRSRRCSPRSTASASARTTSRASSSPTSTSTTPAASATSRRRSRTRRCTCTRRARGTSRTRRGSSRRQRSSTATCSTRSTVGSPPTPAERLHVLEDLEEIDLGGGRTLTAVDSPGHAKHHLALHDSASGILFAGDAVGRAPPRHRRAAPRDAAAGLRPLPRRGRRCAGSPSARPSGVALAHYGLLDDPAALLAEADEVLVQLGRGRRGGLACRRGHRRRAQRRLRAPRRRRRAPGEGRGALGRALERRGAAAVLRDASAHRAPGVSRRGSLRCARRGVERADRGLEDREAVVEQRLGDRERAAGVGRRCRRCRTRAR